ncbi:MAG: indolepyruvate oxidoreductase subunit beta [Desulfobacula sp.]|jgi:indolepyruvate ferredoxin oxidoreductase beta subunit|nr:indolepyruvate oxidoreductase subunit beta [Desulfobacula sp.]
MNLTKIMIVAVGGQGNILAARVIGEAAIAAGVPVRMSEFHGMAQRGGVVESMILLGKGNTSCISDGEADVLLGFEPCETIRAMPKCNADSVVITNTRPVPPFTVGLGIDQYPDVGTSMEKIQGRVQKLVQFNATELSMEAGSKLSLNMVMLGALVHTLKKPLTPDLFRRMIREKTKAAFVSTNLKAFDLGYEAAGPV